MTRVAEGGRSAARADVRRVLWSRGLRAFGDGYVAILLPVHLSSLGFGAAAVGVTSTVTLLGSALRSLLSQMDVNRPGFPGGHLV